MFKAKDERLHTNEQLFNYVRCQHCGSIFINPQPDENELEKYYSETFFAYALKSSKKISDYLNKVKYRQVSSFSNKGKVLDVGCADGGLLHMFKSRGWQTYGVDTSEKACRLAKNTLGNNVFNCNLTDCSFPENYFDTIILNHVIEHMTNPNKELAEIHRILKPNGAVFLYTPNAESFQFKVTKEKWLHLDAPRHLILYSQNTLSFVLKNAGLQVAKVSFPMFDFPFDLYNSLTKKMPASFENSRILLSPALRLISIVVKLLPSWRGSVAVAALKKSE